MASESSKQSNAGVIICTIFIISLIALITTVTSFPYAPYGIAAIVPIIVCFVASFAMCAVMPSQNASRLTTPEITFGSEGSRRSTAVIVRMDQTLGSEESAAEVQVLRGGEFVGNRLRYKVKILNKSKYVITDVTVSLVTYPRGALSVEGPTAKSITKIEPSGFMSPAFEFLPTQDCVKGDIVANVSYVDHEGRAYSTMTEPYTVRSVCDLLMPERISPDDFERRLENLTHGEMASRVDEWTPEEMHSKALQVLGKSNFSEVKSERAMIGEKIESRVTGWARGKYTGKNLGVEITITGRPDTRGAVCRIRISGQDEAMILPAIDEMSHNLSAWLCPVCVGELPPESVDGIRAGRHAKCPFCGAIVGR